MDPPQDLPYAKDRYRARSARLYGVLDRQLANNRFVAGDFYSIADMAIWPWAPLPLDPAHPVEGRRPHPDAEMRLAPLAPAGMAAMTLALVHHLQRHRREGRRELVADPLRHTHFSSLLLPECLQTRRAGLTCVVGLNRTGPR
jgi:glutathione S-transferase